MEAGQLSRFGDWDSVRRLCRVGGLDDSQAFFAGDAATKRMAEVRKAISDVRVNWHLYPQFMKELGRFLEEVPEPDIKSADPAYEYAWQVGRERMRALLSSQKEWLDSGGPAATEDAEYTAIRLYSSIYGYKRMFQAINLAFRAKNLLEYPLALRSATFLIELLNIDLYNYRELHPDADSFEGRVFRGMRVARAEIDAYERAAINEPISNRYLAVPLAMMSASSDRAYSLKFARKKAAEQSAGTVPLLWDVTVHSLDQILLSAYRRAFPASVVTSMCAVPIHEVADFPKEREVLLRGPHFQILSVYKDEDSLPGEALNVVEAIMLNSNRDHITAIATNTGEDLRARNMFGTMINAHRSALCAERAMACGLPRDADAYQDAAARARERLEEEL